MEDLEHIGLGVVLLPKLGRACDKMLVFEDRTLLTGKVPAAELSLKGSFTVGRLVSEIARRLGDK